MSSELNLRRLRLGEEGRILRLDPPGNLSIRLHELGFAPGNRAEALFHAFGGGFTAYLVGSSIIALRAADAEKIIIERI